MSSHDPILNVSGLHHQYGENLVLGSVDLEMGRGEFVSIIGPSGCGKTTLLKLLHGLETPTSGSIDWVDGVHRAMVFQDARLLPWRNVLDNVGFALECIGTSVEEARAQAEEALQAVGLGGAAALHPHALSGGMKQRVGLARALVRKPDVLLLDEPFSALDVDARASLQQQLLELWSSHGFTVLFVSHSLDEVVRMSDRVVFLGGEPSHVQHVETVNLARPRGVDAESQVAIVRAVDGLTRWFQ